MVAERADQHRHAETLTARLNRDFRKYLIRFEKETIVSIDIGISEKDRAEIAEGLNKVLADTYSLYLMTHNFHWNVTGRMFETLHLMFETQYNELAIAVDLVAERIRALGFPAPATYREFVRLSSIRNLLAR